MGGVKSTWNGDAAYKLVLTAGNDAIKRVTLAFWMSLQRVLNRKVNPPPYRNSAPKGEPPYKRTGNLAANVVYEIDEANMSSRVGLLPAGKYGIPLELSKQQNHPWLMPTLIRMMDRLRTIAEGGR